MTFEEFLYEKADCKNVEWVENWIANLDLEDIFILADEFVMKEKNEMLDRLETNLLKKGEKNEHQRNNDRITT